LKTRKTKIYVVDHSQSYGRPALGLVLAMQRLEQCAGTKFENAEDVIQSSKARQANGN
jgi:hypothetical protein